MRQEAEYLVIHHLANAVRSHRLDSLRNACDIARQGQLAKGMCPYLSISGAAAPRTLQAFLRSSKQPLPHQLQQARAEGLS